MKNWIILFSLLFTNLILLAQSKLEPGFRLLETGKFEEAKYFFENYLVNDNSNKTALLCYGRAVGLSGEPKKATTIFSNLLREYPNDFEIEINFYESYLWARDYEIARPLYEDLVARQPDKFAAVLGLANTLSNLKEYELALEWINKALLLEANNESAKISKKYIKLGFANKFVNDQDYSKGIQMLHEIFEDFPNDKDALLNLANIYLITKNVEGAKSTYWRYATSPKDSITARNGVSLAEHIGEKEREALAMASMAKSRVAIFADSLLTERTYDRYVQALIWNRKFIIARHQIDSLQIVYPDANWVFALRATLGMYTGDFKTSLSSYNAILKKDSASFDGNLGKANALFASDKIIPAYEAAFQTLRIFRNQKDANSFIEKLNAQHAPWIETHASYTFDNGNNTAYSSNSTAAIFWSTKFQTTFSYNYRNTQNTVTGNKAQSHVILTGIQYKFLPKTILKTVLGFNNSRFMQDAYTQPVFDLKIQMQPLKLQNLDLGYQREVQSFNADLIEREIVMNHYGLNYNLGTNFNLGWYTQLIYTQQTDNNKRNLLFTSLYYSLLRKPMLKMGLNYQYLSFANQVPTIYFSPEKYRAAEVFADLRGLITEETTFMASVAAGYQNVEDDATTAIFRAEAGMQYQFSKRFSCNVYGKYSNIASATAAGFEFTEMGIKLKWLLSEKPLFWKQVAANN
ncbi:MAG: tetratricopeptide repeat protein [Flavobacteriaceae bacterium]